MLPVHLADRGGLPEPERSGLFGVGAGEMTIAASSVMALRQCPLTCGLPTRMTEHGFLRACAARMERLKKLAEVSSTDPHAAWCRECNGEKRPEELEIIGKEEMMAEREVISVGKQYDMPQALAGLLRPMSTIEAETITVSGLAKYWRRPLIRSGANSQCPCCGGVHPLKAGGICSGCYSDKVMKNKLTGPALLEHLAIRATGGIGRGRRPEMNDIKKSTNPAPESSSPAATPPAGAGLVESDPRPESTEFENVFRVAIGLSKDSSRSEFPQHLENLMRERDRFRIEIEDLTEILGAVEGEDLPRRAEQLIKTRDQLREQTNMLVAAQAETARILGAGEYDSLAQVAARVMQELTLEKAKREGLTQEIAELNRVLAVTPSHGPQEEPWQKCENILQLLGIGNGSVFSSLKEASDLGVMTAGLVRGAVEEGILRIDDGVLRPDPIQPQEVTDQDIVAKWSGFPVPDGYEALTAVLHDAIDQAAHGKGLERHADDRPFHDQPIMRETQAVGLGFPAGQARKKILEAVHCCDNHPERAVADLLGAINYTAAAVIAIRAMMVEQAK